jgi:hypothetical protein
MPPFLLIDERVTIIVPKVSVMLGDRFKLTRKTILAYLIRNIGRNVTAEEIAKTSCGGSNNLTHARHVARAWKTLRNLAVHGIVDQTSTNNFRMPKEKEHDKPTNTGREYPSDPAIRKDNSPVDQQQSENAMLPL